jgi:hypothetical protein
LRILSDTRHTIGHQFAIHNPEPEAPPAAYPEFEHPDHHVILTAAETVSPATATMDYSASINDPEHPVEASPWGSSPSSSPRPNRSNFGPLYPNSNSGLDDNGFAGSDVEYRRPDTAGSTVSQSTEPRSEGSAPGEPYAEQGVAGDQGPLSPQPPQPQQPQQQQQQPPKPAADQQPRAQQQQQQPRKPPPPQFKLQAKITGLERTGRKDPILRFDVHVRPPLPREL